MSDDPERNWLLAVPPKPACGRWLPLHNAGRAFRLEEQQLLDHWPAAANDSDLAHR
jgi:hypothetical protein